MPSPWIEPTPWNGVKPVVFGGILVVLIRYVLDCMKVEQAWFIGVFWYTVVALAVLGFSGRVSKWRFREVLRGAVIVGAVLWGAGNLLAYSTAAFQDWTHGRFDPTGSGPPRGGTPELDWAPRDSPLGKVMMVAIPTLAGTLVGAIWCTVWGSVFILLPNRRNRS